MKDFSERGRDVSSSDASRQTKKAEDNILSKTKAPHLDTNYARHHVLSVSCRNGKLF